uniref:GHMP kinase C-terminal domain-containing protein n=1 Tax=Chlamydomonas leiostraca TaxID=1034604 RepID=A0A7S0WY27_9CHLO
MSGKGAGLAGLPGSHLANLTPSQLASGLAGQLPEELGGQEFLDAHGPHLDAVTTVDPARRYAVRTAACHPIHEHARVRAFQQLLRVPQSNEQLSLLGELMMQSHESYSACGLGSGGTDRMVALVREHMAAAARAGRPPALWGAKITGGGCGGTVCILGSASEEAEAAVAQLVADYCAATGQQGVHVFRGSSVGAVAFGHVVVRLSL